MALIECPDCGKRVSDAAEQCIGCGRPMTEAAAPPVEAASSPHAMVCEGCGSSDVRKFSVVYEEQSSTSSSKTTLAGAGLGPSGLGVGLARGGTTGTSHTRLASRTTPPNMEKMSKEDPVTRLDAALAGRYTIERELGEGGMATVYLADDLKHERKVALKVLKPELAAVVGAERFLAEIKTTANLQHPHILPLFDSGEADSFLFYVMPYIEGETLADRLERESQLPVDEAVKIATEIADALQAAHEQGVIHRDIKPARSGVVSVGTARVGRMPSGVHERMRRDDAQIGECCTGSS